MNHPRVMLGITLCVTVACAPGRREIELPAQVGIVVTDGLFITEASAPFDVYVRAGEDNVDVFYVAETMDPIVGYYNELLYPDYTFDTAPELDVLVVPSGANSMDSDLQNEAYIGYIREQAERAPYVTSHCWGAFALAAAGVLDGLRATTFPGYTDDLGSQFPDIGELVTTDRWVADDDGAVVTSNGGLAAYEASLHVVEQVFGTEVAEGVAAGLVFDDQNLSYARQPQIGSAPGSAEALPPLEQPMNVAVLIMDGLYVGEATAPYDIFAHAGDSMNVYFVAATEEPITGAYGDRLAPHYTFANAPQADVLVIPSGAHSMDAQLDDAALIAWVADQAAGATWITSHCLGAFTLASAGLLDGLEVTTFPGYFEDLRTAFPAIGVVREDARIVRHGNVVTSAGGLAAYEGALYVVEQILGGTAGDVIAGGLVFSEANLDNVRSAHVAP